MIGVVERANDLLPFGYGCTIRRRLGHGLAGDGEAIAVSKPASSSVFMSGRMPPMATSALMLYLPLGLRSASTGTRLPMRVKSSMVSFTFAACAMASRCNTAFVEPPSAMTTVMAFSKAFS